MPRFISSLALACCLASCSAEDSRQQESGFRLADSDVESNGVSSTAPTESLDDYTCEALVPLALNVVPTRGALRAAIGPPDSIYLSAQPNRHVPGQEDSVFIVYYPGLWSSGVRPGGSGRDLIERVLVTDNRYLQDRSVGIGADALDVQRRVRTDWSDGSQGPEADCGYEVPQGAILHVQEGTVRSVAFTFYVD